MVKRSKRSEKPRLEPFNWERKEKAALPSDEEKSLNVEGPYTSEMSTIGDFARITAQSAQAAQRSATRASKIAEGNPQAAEASQAATHAAQAAQAAAQAAAQLAQAAVDNPTILAQALVAAQALAQAAQAAAPAAALCAEVASELGPMPESAEKQATKRS